jgi:hypothetical protein
MQKICGEVGIYEDDNCERCGAEKVQRICLVLEYESGALLH